MSLLQLVYASRPFGFDAPTLMAILLDARANNAAADVTGCLICRDDLYLQMLEGPAGEVERIYANITQDDRHVEVTQLAHRSVKERMFEGWAMRDDPVQSWMWTRDQVDQGAVNAAPTDEVLGIFRRLALEPPQADA